jgi:hypothetical protein
MSQSPVQPVTAFSPEYLAALRERDEPVTATDPDIIGPWRIWRVFPKKTRPLPKETRGLPKKTGLSPKGRSDLRPCRTLPR